MDLSGIFVPLVTPFAADGGVDAEALRGLADAVLAEGAAGLVALGTTGEPATLTAAERATVVEVCTSTGAPVLIGVGGASTASCVAEVAGLPPGTAAMVVVPPYTRPGESGVVAHFRAVAAAASVPVVIYHVPYRTGQALSAAALLELAAIPNVAGLKLSDGAVSPATVALLAAAPPSFAVLGGDDAVISPLLAQGARGGILASAHVATARFVALHAAWRDGDVVTARALGGRLAALSEALFAEPNPAVVKAVLHALGRIPTPAVRLPLLPATAAARSRALNLLHHAEAARQENAHAEAARQENAHAEAARQENAHAEAARQDNARANAARQDDARAEAARQDDARDRGLNRPPLAEAAR